MKLDFNSYKSKVLGCFEGKNIGGTLGAPFECRRGAFDLDFYTTPLKDGALPNDDLDLQLIWLNAAEKYGKNVSASILGEYWQSFVTPNWGEYGAGKNNLRVGIVPPLSGVVNNAYKDSCGAFIRSEIWACLAPANPEIAARYAFEDASVDHAHEGLYAEIFCASMESAAFVESDAYKLIEIGLSYLPAECGIAIGVRDVIASYKARKTWRQARESLLNLVPGSFGILSAPKDPPEPQIPVGAMGWDAPSNIGIMVLGWLYGEDDFGKSICIAAGCGEDADCTAATLGALLGIIGGAESIPEKWRAPLGDSIKTACLNTADQGVIIPKTMDELTERILRLTPIFLGSELCDTLSGSGGYSILCAQNLFAHETRVNGWENSGFAQILARSPFTVAYDFVLFGAQLNYHSEPYAQNDVPKKFTLTIENHFYTQQWASVLWRLPEGWSISPSAYTGCSLEQFHCNIGRSTLEFVLTPHDLSQPFYEPLIEISMAGRHSKGFIPVVLINSPALV